MGEDAVGGEPGGGGCLAFPSDTSRRVVTADVVCDELVRQYSIDKEFELGNNIDGIVELETVCGV
jgi:hypothetical protein